MGICAPSLLDIYDYPQARSANFGSADFPGWYDGKSAYPYQAY